MRFAARKCGSTRRAAIARQLAACSRPLLRRSHTLPVKEGYVEDPITVEWARQVLPEMLAYFIQHRDGFRTTMFLANIQDFNYAGLRSDTDEIISCQMYLPMPGHSATTADFFNPLDSAYRNDGAGKPSALPRRANAAHFRDDAGRGRFHPQRLHAGKHARNVRHLHRIQRNRHSGVTERSLNKRLTQMRRSR